MITNLSRIIGKDKENEKEKDKKTLHIFAVTPYSTQ
jgi:hypothetical protein